MIDCLAMAASTDQTAPRAILDGIRLVFSKRADGQLARMDAGVRRIIVAWLLKNVDGCDGPRAHGKGLTGNLSGEWRYRIGDYRVLCEIRKEELVVLALEVGHGRQAYKCR